MRAYIHLIVLIILNYFALSYFHPRVKISQLTTNGIQKATAYEYYSPIIYNHLDIEKPVLPPGVDSMVIPLKRVGKLLMVDAKVDNQLGNLVFDTGATGLVLNKTYFRDHLKVESVSPNGITGSVGTSQRTTIDSLEMGDLLYHNISADLANLGHLENKRGVKILGLFGFNLLWDFEIIIDVNNNLLILHKVDKKGLRANGSGIFHPDFVQEIKECNNIIFIMAMVGGKMLKFCFDTGAEINAISSSLQKNVLNTITITRRSKLSGAGTSQSEVFFGVMNDFKMGNRKMHNMQTIITNLSSLEEAYNVQFSGVLGFDLLEKGVICINLRKREFGIRYNKAGEL